MTESTHSPAAENRVRNEIAVHGGLSARHIQFIAIGGAIGSGLFLGSGQGIATAGPSVLAAYGLSGIIAFFIARALGEMTLNAPIEGNFTGYAEKYFGPWCGFVTGWSYWLSWIVVGMADLTAAGLLMQFWFPALPQWITASVALAMLYLINMLGVRLFGELEFWLALVKVCAIVVLIGVGLVLLLFSIDAGGYVPHVANLWQHNGFFPTGFIGFATVLPIAFFGFGGVELIGLTAREAEHPERSVPRAINSVIARILIFYVGSLAVIMILFPWNQIDGGRSPFVLVFDRIGFGAAASVLNFVVISAVLSSCNSGLFATGRVLATLADKGHAPRFLIHINGRGLPGRGISISALIMCGTVLLNYLVPANVFGYLMMGSAVLLMWNWFIITACHLRYRRTSASAGGARVFPLPFYPLINWIVMAFILAVLVLMITILGMAAASLLVVAWFVTLILIHRTVSRRSGA